MRYNARVRAQLRARSAHGDFSDGLAASQMGSLSAYDRLSHYKHHELRQWLLDTPERTPPSINVEL